MDSEKNDSFFDAALFFCIQEDMVQHDVPRPWETKRCLMRFIRYMDDFNKYYGRPNMLNDLITRDKIPLSMTDMVRARNDTNFDPQRTT